VLWRLVAQIFPPSFHPFDGLSGKVRYSSLSSRLANAS
jgi:hypothetical protein